MSSILCIALTVTGHHNPSGSSIILAGLQLNDLRHACKKCPALISAKTFVIVQIATKYSDILGPAKLIEVFESFKSFEGIPLHLYLLYPILIADRSLLLSRLCCQSQ